MTEVLVNVHQGSLKGKIGIDYAGRTFYSFQGIPYAKPPLGELRFKVKIGYIMYDQQLKFVVIL